MSAEIIQFVPKANPNRDAPLCNAPDAPIRDFSKVAIDTSFYFTWPDTAPSEYLAPDGDCA